MRGILTLLITGGLTMVVHARNQTTYITPDSPDTIKSQLVVSHTPAGDGRIVELRGRMLSGHNNGFRLIWNYIDNNTSCFVEISEIPDSPDMIDLFNNITPVTMSVGIQSDGVDSIIAHKECAAAPRRLQDYHTLRTVFQDGKLSAFFGHSYLEDSLTVQYNIRLADSISVLPSVPMEIVRFYSQDTRHYPAQYIKPDSVFCNTLLQSYDTAGRHPIVGLWNYQGRINEPSKAKPGGNYTLAIIPSRSEQAGYEQYLVVYLDGAQVNGTSWLPGMVKGFVTRGLFTDNMALTWLDARFEPIGSECRAVLRNNDVLDLVFGDLGATLTFGRVPRAAAIEFVAPLSIGTECYR